MRILSILIFVFPFVLGHAQNLEPYVLASAGLVGQGGGYSLSWTVGEMAQVETFSAGSRILTQGFQQPWENPTGIEESSWVTNFQLFPVPAATQVEVVFEFLQAGQVEMELFDAAGKSVLVSPIVQYLSGTKREIIDLSRLSSGIYFLRIKFQNDLSPSGAFLTRKLEIIGN